MKIVFGFIGCLVLSLQLHALNLGDKIPTAVLNIEMIGTDGAKTSLARIQSPKGTLVFFTCNHCPFSKAWEARYAKYGNELKAKGLGVIAINPNDPKKVEEDSLTNMKTKASKLGMTFPYVVDEGSKLAKAFGATKTPEFFLFDSKGILVYTGAFDDSKDEADVEVKFLPVAIDSFLAGKPIAKAETRAVGCGIKFY